MTDIIVKFLYALSCYNLLCQNFVLLPIVRINNKITLSFYYHVRLYCFTCSLDTVLESQQSQEHNNYGLASPYVWMARKHDEGSNQCTSICTAILLLRNER